MGPRMECGFCEGPFKEHWLNTRVHSQWPQFLSLHPSLLSQLPTFSSLWASCHAIWDFLKTESTLSQVLLLIKLCRQCFQHSLTMLSHFLSTTLVNDVVPTCQWHCLNSCQWRCPNSSMTLTQFFSMTLSQLLSMMLSQLVIDVVPTLVIDVVPTLVIDVVPTLFNDVVPTWNYIIHPSFKIALFHWDHSPVGISHNLGYPYHTCPMGDYSYYAYSLGDYPYHIFPWVLSISHLSQGGLSTPRFSHKGLSKPLTTTGSFAWWGEN